MIRKPPRTDGLRDAYKSLIDRTELQSILEPTSEQTDKIFIPKGNAYLSAMDYSYWSRVVIIIRENLLVTNEPFDRTIPAPLHVRVDIQPPNSDDYDVDTAMQAIHETIYELSDSKTINLARANVAMPIMRTSRPLNAMLTEYGYYSSYAIYKTVLGSYG